MTDWRIVLALQEEVLTSDIIEERLLRKGDILTALEDIEMLTSSGRRTGKKIFLRGKDYVVQKYHDGPYGRAIVVQSEQGPWLITAGGELVDKFTYSATTDEDIENEALARHETLPAKILEFLINHEGSVVREKDILNNIAARSRGITGVSKLMLEVRQTLNTLIQYGFVQKVNDLVVVTEKGRTFFENRK